MSEQYDVLSEEDVRDRTLIERQAATEMWHRTREMYRWTLSLQNAQRLSGRKFTVEEARQVREVMRMIGEMQKLDSDRNG